MKTTNVLLIILICLIAYNLPKKAKKTVATKSEGIIVGKSYTKTKSIKPKVLEKPKNKHATTFREYIDSDGRSTTSINHSVRIGKDYYVSGGANVRQSSYGSNNMGLNFSLTKYW